VNGRSHAPAAADSIVIVHGPSLTSYSFSDEHPLQPSRHDLTMSLLAALGWLDTPEVSIEEPRLATLSELLTAHTLPFVQAVQLAQTIARGERPATDLRVYGLGTEDNPLFPGIHEAPALLAGAALIGMQAILDGRAAHAYSPAGGMHHAMRARAAGFCIYNDIVVAIAAAVEAGLRVAYVDLDAHHGDGVQAAFYEDPRVLTVSVHESGRFLFPGTGDATEMGAGEGLGACLNVPLPPDSGNTSILMAYDHIVEPALLAYRPDIIVTQTGCDTHHADPLTDLAATMALYPDLAARMHALVHKVCEGRWLIVGGGGYDPADVTPRAWTAFFGAVLGRRADNVVLPTVWSSSSLPVQSS
jgi:acetoin utilization protein AcuC